MVEMWGFLMVEKMVQTWVFSMVEKMAQTWVFSMVDRMVERTVLQSDQSCAMVQLLAPMRD